MRCNRTCRVPGTTVAPRGLRVLLVLFVLASVSVSDPAGGQTAADWAEAAARGFDGRLIEGHFAVAWRLDEGSDAEVH